MLSHLHVSFRELEVILAILIAGLSAFLNGVVGESEILREADPPTLLLQPDFSPTSFERIHKEDKQLRTEILMLGMQTSMVVISPRRFIHENHPIILSILSATASLLREARADLFL